MTTRHRTPRSARAASSWHISQDEAIDRLYWLLAGLDPAHSVPWGAVEGRAVTLVAPGETPWRLAEGDELAAIVDGLREQRQHAA
ncbi:MAG: hypothetical protein ACQEWM_00155 [Actinomycetota bacterium]